MGPETLGPNLGSKSRPKSGPEIGPHFFQEPENWAPIFWGPVWDPLGDPHGPGELPPLELPPSNLSLMVSVTFPTTAFVALCMIPIFDKSQKVPNLWDSSVLGAAIIGILVSELRLTAPLSRIVEG